MHYPIGEQIIFTYHCIHKDDQNPIQCATKCMLMQRKDNFTEWSIFLVNMTLTSRVVYAFVLTINPS